VTFHSPHHALRVLLALALFSLPVQGIAQVQDSTFLGWSERKLTAVTLSTILPGTGQSYLGHRTKGASLTVATFGCGLIAALSENNVIGRNERLDELKAAYALSGKWETSNELWLQMKETKEILDRDAKRRDLFLKVTAFLWIVNVVDVVFFTDDLGENAFGSTERNSPIRLAVISGPHNSVNASFSYRF
jgi:hypothetical protein